MSTAAEENACQSDHPLVPRYSKQGYSSESLALRRQWLYERTGCKMEHIGAHSINCQEMRGNVENPIGAVQVPLGIAGPLLVHGQQATGAFYVPMATTEGALVRSYERGMMAITRAGGAVVRVLSTGNRACPIFSFNSVCKAYEFCVQVKQHFATIKSIAESTTQHGKLVDIQVRQIGKDATIDFQFDTADAHGMNMVSKATERACEWLADQFKVERFYVLSGGSSEKRASSGLFRGGKGKHVVAGVSIPAAVVRNYLKSTPEEIFHMWHRTLLAQLQAGVVGFNGHFANGLSAIFIACGQDVANVTNCSVGITNFDVTSCGGLYASVTLPSLTIGTVGGGTGLGTNRECLEMLDCFGSGKSDKFSEIIAGSLLAGELSFGAALASGGFVEAHESYGRNRPTPHKQEG